MRKSGILLISILFISVFLFSFVLAADNSSSLRCNDSDGGFAYSIFGITTGAYFLDNSTIILRDECFSANIGGVDDDNWLLEGYCDGIYAYTTDYLCPYDCVDGRCVDDSIINANCTDSDGGKIYDKKGTTTGMRLGDPNFTHTDYCWTHLGSDNWLLEGYCITSLNVSFAEHLCEYDCVDGECVDEILNPDCTDSDGGKKFYTKGITIGLHNGDPNWEFEDECINNNWLLEGYCNEEGAYTTDFKCPYGCEDGGCLQTAVGGNTSGDINLTGGGEVKQCWSKDNYWIYIIIGLIIIAFAIVLVVIKKRK